MTTKSSRSSHVSLVSIDPTVVSHITGRSTTQPSHTRAESTPVKPIATPALKGHGRNYSVPIKHHKRSNSLRRAKNSTEMLRQRSSRKERQGSNDQSGDPKRGRNFTVTNVGTGGMLYLRPSAHQRPMSPAISQTPPTPWTAPATTLVAPKDSEAILVPTEDNPLGRGSTARTRSVSPKRLMERFKKTKEAQSLASRPSHTRSQSFSTISESRRSMSDAMPKTLKIVINRSEQTRPKTTETAKPTLEIPIPHYRLGDPRFSMNGTPVLRSSTFTRTSSTPSTRHTSMNKTEGLGLGPPPSSLKAFAKLQPFDLNPDTTVAVESQAALKPEDPVLRASAVSSIGAAPSIYDELSEVYNDPSVVRFAHDIREVTAATPARIIAQISSESFMDYELVSDFFLTFRSYMSTIDVLDLLLARLKWAIGRMSDDGRIIRIRTFAALRHWILNYFMDDYVPNRYLRERFCDEVNDMYDDVSNHYMGVQSDLKILQDLKRCWNGRCSLYWDGEEFSMDGNPDDEIYPGGVLGSRNPDYISTDEVRHIPDQIALRPPPAAIVTVGKRGAPEVARSVQPHQQKPSTASTGPPESLQSEQSIQPNSCSMLLGSKQSSHDKGRPSKGPVPVSVLARRQNAPIELVVATNLQSGPKGQHRRGGNSIDSTRERASMEIPKSAVILPEPHEGSVIRGYVYAPVEPFVQLPIDLPQSPSGRFDTASTSPSITRLQYEYNLGASNPAVKTIFGSIRRALSGKQGYSEVALITVSPQSSNQSLGGKKSPMPLNVSRSQDELRKKASGALSKASIRIDLLCAAAMESYQAAQAAQSAQHQTAQPGAKLSISKSDSLFPPPPLHRHLGEAVAVPSRIPSHGSAESGSILIVNDTDSEIPIMSGAIQPPPRRSSQRTHSSVEHYLPHERTSFETQIAFEDDGHMDEIRENDTVNEARITQSSELRPQTPEHQRVLSDTASSGTMRNRRSLSSSVAHNRIIGSPGPTASVVTPPQDYHDGTSVASPKPATHTLRRRPGGDLRKNQNVHDLEHTMDLHNHHPSVDSLANTFSTAPDSLLTMENGKQARQVTMQHIRRVSMINTHSSQHLRPSFEAAVAGFSSIPDDDDGGLEATLLKLEGKYEKTPELGGQSPPDSVIDRFSGDARSKPHHDVVQGSSPITGRGYVHHLVPEQVQGHESKPHSHEIPPPHLIQKHPVFGLQIQSARSEASTDSVPLLKRDVDELQHAGTFGNQTGGWQQIIIPPKHSKSNSREANALRGPSPGSYLTADNSNPHSGQSLLGQDDNEDGDDRSDLSSEISVDIINYSEAMGSTNSPLLVAPGTAVSGLEIPSHPLAHSSFVNLSLHPSLALDSKTSPVDNPKFSEPILLKVGHADSKVVRANAPAQARINMQRGGKISAGPAHLPFILACDSQMLAQQFTLVEQAALTEVEWSDLVEMRWSSSAATALDWTEYIANQNVKGVDLVITRFNLMVKWTLSEIVLTQDADERVRVISKFIHVAAHARRLHNYATMLQITIALTSTDSTRMSKTWDLVPGPDRSLLKNMEALIQPVRNFHDLRLEMESADLSDGCIPFIGLYIHDLTYNAQKSVEIDIGNGLPPLINFERFRTTATIVKGLLRLIDASSRYEFEPLHGVVERCLWIAALPEERIRSLSRALQE